MRYLGATLLAAAAAAWAKPHSHGHGHVHRHDVADRAVARAVDHVEIVIVYELEGHPISEAEVREGLANGTLTWNEEGTPLSSAAVSSVVVAPTTTSLKSPEQDATAAPSSTKIVEVAPSDQSSDSSPQAPTEPGSYQPVDQDGNCLDCDKEFPNGKYDCSQFPEGYGATHQNNEGLGGWTGIQAPSRRDFNSIMTVPSGSCSDGTCCTPGRYCSYACPNPYLKMSFPKEQGAKKESVGGLFCNANGKLEMADGSIGKSLCGRGSTRMRVMVQSKLSKPVSICRTDYPGTEAETLPLTIQPGETKEIANPDQSKYWFWDNKPTSAQYYINNQGVSEAQACTWGNGQGDTGNRAPVNLGTSFDDIHMNTGFPALFANKPTNPDAKLNFAIQFTGDGVTNACSYKNGQYCTPAGQCNPDGCTASVKDGKVLTVVFSDN